MEAKLRGSANPYLGPEQKAAMQCLCQYFFEEEKLSLKMYSKKYAYDSKHSNNCHQIDDEHEYGGRVGCVYGKMLPSVKFPISISFCNFD